MATSELDEDGEILPSELRDSPEMERVVNTSRALEREMVCQYIAAVAEGQTDPKVTQAMDVIRTEIEKGSHDDFYRKTILASDGDS